MMTRHPGLLLCWAATITAFVIGCAINDALLIILPFLASMVLSICSCVAARAGVLRYRAFYYVLVGTLLAASATTLVAAGSTLFVEPGTSSRVVGFSVLGAFNVLVVVLTWRALVTPTARRAALAGMAAVLGELITMCADVVMNHRMPGFDRFERWIEIALWGSFIAMGTGVLACIAALASFVDPDDHEIPEAHVIAPGTHVVEEPVQAAQD